MLKLLFASGNKGKLHEFRALMENMDICLLTPADVGLGNMEVEEDGRTYAENATLKARTFERASGLLTIADDSGLEVAALDGSPGIFSARYSPKPHATDSDRRVYLLEQLRGFPQPWLAKFVCSIAIAFPDGTLKLTEGICPGEIIPNERGSSGFGYDPLFFIPSLGRTMAELTLQEKNTLSHRARAVMSARAILEQRIAMGD